MMLNVLCDSEFTPMKIAQHDNVIDSFPSTVSAVRQVVLCVASLILIWICWFAQHKTHWLEIYILQFEGNRHISLIAT